MKKRSLNYRGVAAAIIIASVCSIAWTRPSAGGNDKDKGKQATTATEPTTTITPVPKVPEETLLVELLEKDGLINQVVGFRVEKRKSTLFINGVMVPDDVATKYISRLKKENIWVQVNSLGERMKQHPGANFLQLLMPVMMSSPCVQNKSKDGC